MKGKMINGTIVKKITVATVYVLGLFMVGYVEGIIVGKGYEMAFKKKMIRGLNRLKFRRSGLRPLSFFSRRNIIL